MAPPTLSHTRLKALMDTYGDLKRCVCVGNPESKGKKQGARGRITTHANMP